MEILRNLWRRKLRNFLTISGIAIGIMAFSTMGAMAEKNNKLIDGGVKYFSDHVTVGDSTSGQFGGGLIQTDKSAKGPGSRWRRRGLPRRRRCGKGRQEQLQLRARRQDHRRRAGFGKVLDLQ